MRCVLMLVATVAAVSAQQKGDVNTRLGLVGPTNLGGKHPLGAGAAKETESLTATGRNTFGQQCCCIPIGTQCNGNSALVANGNGNYYSNVYDGYAGIDARLKNPKQSSSSSTSIRNSKPPKSSSSSSSSSSGSSGISFGKRSAQQEDVINTRIVNRPGDRATSDSFGNNYSTNNNKLTGSCEAGFQPNPCCFDPIDTSVFGRSCAKSADQKNICSHYFPQNQFRQVSSKQCGQRVATYDVRGHRERVNSSPGEYPWMCMLLKDSRNEDKKNDFVGSCAIVPQPGSSFTRTVITAAHKLKNFNSNTEVLKVRIGEWDASGFDGCNEKFSHTEYRVHDTVIHPRYGQDDDPKTGKPRLNYNMAILFINDLIDTRVPYVNSACLPSLSDMSSFQTTDAEYCYVAGWGKDGKDGEFSFLQRHVGLKLYNPNNQQCQQDINSALRRKGFGSVRIGSDEICAGGLPGEDACLGDGGAPLVCKHKFNKRWYVVGLVTWGVGCGDAGVPGVYSRVSYFADWINQNIRSYYSRNNCPNIATCDNRVMTNRDKQNNNNNHNSNSNSNNNFNNNFSNNFNQGQHFNQGQQHSNQGFGGGQRDSSIRG